MIILACVTWNLMPFARSPLPMHASRFSRSVRLIRCWLVTGMVWYGITRLLQTALLLWLLIVADARLRTTAPFIICVVVCAALTGVQAYTFCIYAVSSWCERSDGLVWVGCPSFGVCAGPCYATPPIHTS